MTLALSYGMAWIAKSAPILARVWWVVVVGLMACSEGEPRCVEGCAMPVIPGANAEPDSKAGGNGSSMQPAASLDLPFFEDFEAGTLKDAWTITAPSGGRAPGALE